MLKRTGIILTLTLFLIITGCEQNLEAPVSEPEINADRTVAAAYTGYMSKSRSDMEATREATKLADEVTSPLRRDGFLRGDNNSQSAGDVFRSVDEKVRELLDKNSKTPIGPPLARQISNIVLHSGLLSTRSKDALSEEERSEAILFYLRAAIANESTNFKIQLKALRTLAPDHASDVNALAQKALSNLRGYKKALRQPVEVPSWIGQEANEAEISELRSDYVESRKKRLQWLNENGMEDQFAELAGQL